MSNFNLEEYLEKTEKELLKIAFEQGKLTATETREYFVSFLRSAIETAVEEVVGVERQRLIDLIKDREFEVVEKRTGALHEMYEAGYQSALSDILKFLEE